MNEDNKPKYSETGTHGEYVINQGVVYPNDAIAAELSKLKVTIQILLDECKKCDWLNYGSCNCPDGACPKIYLLHKHLKPSNIGKIECPSCNRWVYTLRDNECFDCYENRKRHIDMTGRKIIKAIKRGNNESI